MAVFNYSTRELTTKIVYYGPGLCGKTTNLQFIYEHMPAGVRGKMLSLATKTDRTLFFDFLPIDLGQIQGMKTKVQLYTVPGQVFYNETRRLVLKGADGIVFVADSQENMLDANIDSFRNLEENLAAHGLSLETLPHVLQFNKQDLPNALPVEVLNEKLNKYNAPFYEAIATTGVGVQETLRHICKLVLLRLNERYGGGAPLEAGEAAPAASPEGVPSAAAAQAAAAASGATELASDAGSEGWEIAAAGAAAAQAAGTGAPDLAWEAGEASQEISAAGPEAPAAEPAAAGSGAVDLAWEAGAGSQEISAAADGSAPAEEPASAAGAGGPEFAWDSGAGEQGLSAPGVGAGGAFDAGPGGESGEWGAAAEDEDVFGLAEASPPPEPPRAGSTVRIDRNELEAALGAPAAVASATAVEVSAEDPLFQEEIEPTILAPGQPQEILVPIEIHTGEERRRFRLSIRLEMTSQR
ncbi:MAG: hypothetical protein D6718_12525 [Acidobacteria bacterium]|nr:MAG: hypothetical protein D6718_12525 [Acidobacteriota bacterium]